MNSRHLQERRSGTAANRRINGARIQPFVLNGPGKISISYTVGTSALKASCWTRGYYFPDNQYPRFIDVPVTAFFTPKTP